MRLISADVRVIDHPVVVCGAPEASALHAEGDHGLGTHLSGLAARDFQGDEQGRTHELEPMRCCVIVRTAAPDSAGPPPAEQFILFHGARTCHSLGIYEQLSRQRRANAVTVPGVNWQAASDTALLSALPPLRVRIAAAFRRMCRESIMQSWGWWVRHRHRIRRWLLRCAGSGASCPRGHRQRHRIPGPRWRLCLLRARLRPGPDEPCAGGPQPRRRISCHRFSSGTHRLRPRASVFWPG